MYRYGLGVTSLHVLNDLFYAAKRVCLTNDTCCREVHYVMQYPGVSSWWNFAHPEANDFPALATYHHSGMNKRLT